MTQKEDKIGEIDQIDHRILAALVEDGRISVTDLAARVGLSKTPCGLRLRRLIKEKFILGFRAVLNPGKLDRTHVAFTEITLSDTKEAALEAFNQAVRNLPEVEQCHMIAGSFDYLLKVRTKDIKAYRRVLGETITSLPHVASSSTYVAMQSVKETGP